MVRSWIRWPAGAGGIGHLSFQRRKALEGVTKSRGISKSGRYALAGAFLQQSSPIFCPCQGSANAGKLGPGLFPLSSYRRVPMKNLSTVANWFLIYFLVR